jgi:hypothetical protein
MFVVDVRSRGGGHDLLELGGHRADAGQRGGPFGTEEIPDRRLFHLSIRTRAGHLRSPLLPAPYGRGPQFTAALV